MLLLVGLMLVLLPVAKVELFTTGVGASTELANGRFVKEGVFFVSTIDDVSESSSGVDVVWVPFVEKGVGTRVDACLVVVVVMVIVSLSLPSPLPSSPLLLF
ncbi:hypothetical protein EV127DRAFT_418870 [Xylaria flabelliformis]|nr:hypothetical protein EV127DRAFT_418870 [Xylaria flabelliformis]